MTQLSQTEKQGQQCYSQQVRLLHHAAAAVSAEAVSENSKTAGHFVGEVGSGWWNRKVTIDFIISITNWKLEQKFRLHAPILICSTLQKVLKKLKTSDPSYPSGRLLISPKFILLHDNKLKPPGRVMKNCLQDLWLLLFFKGTRWWQQIL